MTEEERRKKRAERFGVAYKPSTGAVAEKLVCFGFFFFPPSP